MVVEKLMTCVVFDLNKLLRHHGFAKHAQIDGPGSWPGWSFASVQPEDTYMGEFHE